MKNFKVVSTAVVLSSLIYNVGCNSDSSSKTRTEITESDSNSTLDKDIHEPYAESEIVDKVKNVISTRLNVEMSSVRLESKLVQSLGADSLDLVEICMDIEKEFQILVEDKDLEGVKTVNDAVKVVKKYVKVKQ